MGVPELLDALQLHRHGRDAATARLLCDELRASDWADAAGESRAAFESGGGAALLAEVIRVHAAAAPGVAAAAAAVLQGLSGAASGGSEEG